MVLENHFVGTVDKIVDSIIESQKTMVRLNVFKKNKAARARWQWPFSKRDVFPLLNPMKHQSKTLKYLTSLLVFLSNRQ